MRSKIRWPIIAVAVWLLVFGGAVALGVFSFQKQVPGNVVVIPSPTPTPTPTPIPPGEVTTTYSAPVTLTPTSNVGYITIYNGSDYALTMDSFLTDLPVWVGSVSVSGGPVPAQGSALFTVILTPDPYASSGSYPFIITFNLSG